MPETLRMNILSNPMPQARRVSPAVSIIGPKGGDMIIMTPDAVTIRPPRHIKALTRIAKPKNTDPNTERLGGLDSLEGLSNGNADSSGSCTNYRSVSFSSMRRLRA